MDDLDARLARYEKQGAVPARDKLSEIDALLARYEQTQQSQQPQSATPTTGSDYLTTTATTPGEQKKEQRSQAVEDIQRGDRADAVEAFGYGAARGATLGTVDRLVGLGTAIGEHAGATDQTPAQPNTYKNARADYLEKEDEARQNSPLAHSTGEIVGGLVPGIAASPLKFAGRFGNPALMGAAAGAGNTRSEHALDILAGAGEGAATGIATEATLGTVARKAIRKAPERQENTTIRDIMESDAGRATPTTGMKLGRDIDDVRSVLREDPELAKAMRKPAKEAQPVVQERIRLARDGQTARYAEVDKALAKQPLTVTGLLRTLVEAEEDVPDKRLALVKRGLKSLRDSLRNDFAPRWSGSATWKGARTPITTEQLRSWVTSVQATAEAAMGGINGTNAYKVPEDIAKIANAILEERLDTAARKGARDAVTGIRESDRRVAALLNIDRALEDRGRKELAQAVGLGRRMDAANAKIAIPALVAGGQVAPAAAVAVRGPLQRIGSGTAREFNDRVLAPIQRAAEAGKPWGEILRMGAESGLSQSFTRTMFERFSPKDRMDDRRTSTETGL